MDRGQVHVLAVGAPTVAFALILVCHRDWNDDYVGPLRRGGIGTLLDGEAAGVGLKSLEVRHGMRSDDLATTSVAQARNEVLLIVLRGCRCDRQVVVRANDRDDLGVGGTTSDRGRQRAKRQDAIVLQQDCAL